MWKTIKIWSNHSILNCYRPDCLSTTTKAWLWLYRCWADTDDPQLQYLSPGHCAHDGPILSCHHRPPPASGRCVYMSHPLPLGTEAHKKHQVIFHSLYYIYKHANLVLSQLTPCFRPNSPMSQLTSRFHPNSPLSQLTSCFHPNSPLSQLTSCFHPNSSLSPCCHQTDYYCPLFIKLTISIVIMIWYGDQIYSG